jgi:hypothetical protein
VLRPALALVLLGLTCGCASRPRTAPVAGTAGLASPTPWSLAPGDAPSQRLFRAEVRRGDERGGLRLVLRVWSSSRFELTASDSLGRPLWALVARDERGAWRQGGGREVCRQDPRRSISWPRLGLTFPAADLPAILLGRLPEAPADGSVVPAVEGSFDFDDSAGRRWRATLAGGKLVRWSVAGEAGEVEWRLDDGGARLELAAARLEIRWREVAREPLRGTAPALPAELESAPECAFEDLS